jgi:general secretion pathway protein K
MTACRDKGFALLAVLWIAAMLSVIAMSYATSARVDAEGARNILRRQKLDDALYSGLVFGEHEYEKYTANQGLSAKQEEIESTTGKELNLWYPRFEPYNATIGGRTVFIRLRDLSGKMALSAVDSALMTRILEACGADEPTRNDIKNAWLDWEDEDDLHRLNGAETDFYLKTAGAYMAKNAEMENPEELLLVKGVTRELYYGTEEYPGLIDFLGMEGSSSVMDVNSAGPKAFLLVENLSSRDIENILALRKEKPIRKMAELNDVVPVQAMSEFKKYFGLPASSGVAVQASLHANATEFQGLTRVFGQE